MESLYSTPKPSVAVQFAVRGRLSASTCCEQRNRRSGKGQTLFREVMIVCSLSRGYTNEKNATEIAEAIAELGFGGAVEDTGTQDAW